MKHTHKNVSLNKGKKVLRNTSKCRKKMHPTPKQTFLPERFRGLGSSFGREKGISEMDGGVRGIKDGDAEGKEVYSPYKAKQ